MKYYKYVIYNKKIKKREIRRKKKEKKLSKLSSEVDSSKNIGATTIFM